MSNYKNRNYLPALGYHFLTKFYDLIMKIAMPIDFRQKVVKQINAKGGDKILDFGIGTGEISIMVGNTCSNCEITGIDVDPKILRIAKRKVKKVDYNISIITYDGDLLPFPKEYFDKVIVCLVFCNLTPANKTKYLNEIHRVLKKNGYLFIFDFGFEPNILKRNGFLFFRYLTPLRRIGNNANQLENALQNANFSNIECQQFLKTITGTLYYYRIKK